MVEFSKRHHIWLAVFWCVSGMLFNCSDSGKPREDGESIYVSVNGTILNESEFRALVPAEFYDRLSPAHKKEIAREWVNSELLYQEALRLGVDKEPGIAHILEKSKRNLLSAEILSRKIANIVEPGDDELKRYYDDNKDFFILQSDEYEVRYALFDTIDDARTFYGKVKKGTSFSDLAKEDSKDPSAHFGGYLGVVNEESVEPAMWNEIVSTHERLGLTKISNPFSVIEGFGIVIVDEVFKMGTLKPFELVRDQVLDYYMMEKREAEKENFLKSLSTEANIEYYF